MANSAFARCSRNDRIGQDGVHVGLHVLEEDTARARRGRRSGPLPRTRREPSSLWISSPSLSRDSNMWIRPAHYTVEQPGRPRTGPARTSGDPPSARYCLKRSSFGGRNVQRAGPSRSRRGVVSVRAESSHAPASIPGEGRMLRKILAVDDSALIHQMYKLFLSRYKNCKLVSAMNGLEALDKLGQEEEIDLILLDINMPVMNGLEFLQRVQKEAGLQGDPGHHHLHRGQGRGHGPGSQDGRQGLREEALPGLGAPQPHREDHRLVRPRGARRDR